MSAIKTCNRCEFFSAHNENTGPGECRRHAPRIVCGQLYPDTTDDSPREARVFPFVLPFDFCGEFFPSGAGA